MFTRFGTLSRVSGLVWSGLVFRLSSSEFELLLVSFLHLKSSADRLAVLSQGSERICLTRHPVICRHHRIYNASILTRAFAATQFDVRAFLALKIAYVSPRVEAHGV